MPLYRVRDGQTLGVNDGVKPYVLVAGQTIELAERIAAEIGGRVELVDETTPAVAAPAPEPSAPADNDTDESST